MKRLSPRLFPVLLAVQVLLVESESFAQVVGELRNGKLQLVLRLEGVWVELETPSHVDPPGSTVLALCERSIDELVLAPSLDVASVDGDLRRRLARRIESIDATCKLTPEQSRKLDLAGRAQIQKYFDRVEEMKAPLRKIRVEVEDRRARVPPAFDAIRPAQTFLDLLKGDGPFGDSSLFGKALRKTLTPDQLAEYNRRTTNNANTTNNVRTK